MKKYLSTLKDKPHHHKKRFAMLVSGSFTLLIFAIWSFVTFGTLSSGVKIAETKEIPNEPSPLSFLGSNLGSNFASSIQSVKGDWQRIVESLKGIDLNTEYGEMRTKAVETYGQ